MIHQPSQNRVPISLAQKLLRMRNPPEGDFIYLLPLTIFGYNMIEKKWGKQPWHFMLL